MVWSLGTSQHHLLCLPLWPGLSFSFPVLLVSFGPKVPPLPLRTLFLFLVLFEVLIIRQAQLPQHFFKEGALRMGAFLFWFHASVLCCTYLQMQSNPCACLLESPCVLLEGKFYDCGMVAVSLVPGSVLSIRLLLFVKFLKLINLF